MFKHEFDNRTAVLAAVFPTAGVLLLNGYWNAPLYRISASAYWAVDVASHVAIPLVALVLLARRGVMPRDYGLRRARGASVVDLAGRTFFVCVAFWLCLVPVSRVLAMLLGSEATSFSYFDVMPQGGFPHALVAVYFSVSAGLFEEIMYRGLPWLYVGLLGTARPPVTLYVVGSSTLFGFAHWENGLHEVLSTGVLGVAACALYVKIRNLWPLVLAHIALDLHAYW